MSERLSEAPPDESDAAELHQQSRDVHSAALKRQTVQHRLREREGGGEGGGGGGGGETGRHSGVISEMCAASVGGGELRR